MLFVSVSLYYALFSGRTTNIIQYQRETEDFLLLVVMLEEATKVSKTFVVFSSRWVVEG